MSFCTNLLRAYVLDVKGNWDDYLPLVKFAYNNSFQYSIGMTPFKGCMVGDIDLLFVGLMLEKENFQGLDLYN